jgi:hypothetical protein
MKSMLKRRLVEVSERAKEPAPRVVYTQAPVILGVVLARESRGWRVRLGRTEQVMGVDPSVDPVLLAEAIVSSARVVIDTSEDPVIVGLLVTTRGLAFDRDGNVNASVRNFRVSSAEEVLLKTRASFLQLKEGDVEIYGHRLVSRARELVKILGRLIKLN